MVSAHAGNAHVNGLSTSLGPANDPFHAWDEAEWRKREAIGLSPIGKFILQGLCLFCKGLHETSNAYVIQLNCSTPALVHKGCNFIAEFIIACNSIPPLTRTQSKYWAPAKMVFDLRTSGKKVSALSVNLT